MTTNRAPQPQPVVLEQTFSSADAALRFGFAAVALVGAVWLLWVDTRPIPRLAAAAALGFGWLWLSRFRQQRRAPPSSLELHTDRLVLRNGKDTTEVLWANVVQLEMDHDGLAIYAVLSDGGELRIDAGYGGLGLSALGQRLQDELVVARGCVTPSDG